MKKIIYFLVLFPILVIGQTQSLNYVKSTTYKQPTTTSISSPDINTASIGVTYFDGLGRPIQKIANKQSASSNDIITHIEYDEFGRQVKEFLPFASTSNTMQFDSNALGNTLNYSQYLNQTPYSQKSIEDSPLNRILLQSAPGSAWAIGSGHEIKYDYKLNLANEVINFSVSTSGELIHYGYYKPNLIRKTITKNENWQPSDADNNTTQEFKDNFDRVILKRTFDNNVPFDTYYVYDKIGNLTFVLPPKFLEDFSVPNDSTPNTCNYSTSLDFKTFMASAYYQGYVIQGGGGASISIANGNITINFSGGFENAILNENAMPLIVDPSVCSLPNMAIGYIKLGTSSYDYFVYIENNRLRIVKKVSWQADVVINGFSETITAPIDQIYSQTVVTGAGLDGICYQYKYDKYNRQVEKKLPGKQWEYIVYDKLDRVVATAPAFNPFGGSQVGWLITKYDVFGRVAYTGWKQTNSFSSQVRQTYQSDYNHDNLVLYETRVNSTVDNVAIGYGNQVTPTTGMKLLTVNYYDNYSFPNAPQNTTGSVYGEPYLQNVKGLSTGNWIRVLSSNPDEVLAEKSYTFYDKKSRPIQVYKSNYLGGYTRVNTQYDFSGQVLKTDTKHARNQGTNAITTVEQYEYTSQGRLLNHLHQVNGGAIELIAHNTYDELGKLITKNVGGQNLANFTGLQKVDYQYNIRGWLKSINDVNELAKTSEPLDLFAFKLNYDDVEDDEDGHVSRLFNGNISETFWRTSSDNVLRKYGYGYDALNRLTNSYYQKPDYSEPRTNGYNENLSYDKNGNITSLQRYGAIDVDGQTPPIIIDDLHYVYDQTTQKVNQLVKVTDGTNNPNGFKDDSNDANDANDDYSYDNNGNMISDQNKGIENISYNHLNLPLQINFGATGTISYLYDATGKKVRKRVEDNTTGTNIVTTTDYLDGYQYKDEELQFFPHAEGYVNYFKEHFFYVYNYTDHIGNIRLSYSKDPSTGVLKIIEENHYYPFGLKHGSYNSGKEAYTKEGDLLKIKPVLPLFATSYAYKYNSKEFQNELGLNLYAYGYRYYDPAIARWTTMDPLLNDLEFTFDDSNIDFEDEDEVYEALITKLEIGNGVFNVDNLNPYGYGYNNPISFDDPDGRCPVCLFVVAALLYSEFANAPTGDNATDSRNYNANRDNRSLISETVLQKGDNLLDRPGPTPGVGSKGGPGVSPPKTKKADEISKEKKTYQTYTKKNEKTGEVYSGRTSGNKTPKENVAKRDSNHHKNKDGFGPAKLDKSSKNKDAIRGREQQLIEKNGGAKSQGGTSGNKVNGVSPNNPKRKRYDEASRNEFGS